MIARMCGASLDARDATVTASGVCVDTRKIKRGELFVALAGDRFDGHDFLSQAASSGAAAGLVRRGVPQGAAGMPLLFVDDPLEALGQLAAAHRSEQSGCVVAVAGSNGKTTTKEFLGNVLSHAGDTVWNEASFNNAIGVPLTLLRMDPGTRFLVSEVGTNHPGELEPLLRMVRPRVGVLTSLGREHLEHFGGVEGVLREEGWIAEVLPSDGLLVVNGDTLGVEEVISRSASATVRVGYGWSNDWRLSNYRYEQDSARFELEGPIVELSGDYRVHHIGRHQALNSALAVVVAAMEGLGRESIQQGLLDCYPAPMRLQVWRMGGVRILDDAYNANEDSMMAALQTLGELPVEARRWAVLGDMAELGTHAEAAHRAIGMQAAKSGVNHLFTVGRMSAWIAEGARSAGLAEVTEFESAAAAGEALREIVVAGDAVLIKASRASRLECVGAILREHLKDQTAAAHP